MRSKKKLLVEQLDRKLVPFKKALQVDVPRKGWIYTIRTTLNMTQQQLGDKLGISKQAISDMEERETQGSISVKTMKEVGNKLNVQFVYGYAPIDESIDKMIEKKAIDTARHIVMRTSHNMKLEDQGNSNEYLKKAIEDLANEIKNEIRKSLWD